jgi:hypothetical protein
MASARYGQNARSCRARVLPSVRHVPIVIARASSKTAVPVGEHNPSPVARSTSPGVRLTEDEGQIECANGGYDREHSHDAGSRRIRLLMLIHRIHPRATVR